MPIIFPYHRCPTALFLITFRRSSIFSTWNGNKRQYAINTKTDDNPIEASSQPIYLSPLDSSQKEEPTASPPAFNSPLTVAEKTYLGRTFCITDPSKPSRDIKDANAFYILNGINTRKTRETARFLPPCHVRNQKKYQARKDHFNTLVGQKMNDILTLYGIKRRN
jgi:hypothetical protein